MRKAMYVLAAFVMLAGAGCTQRVGEFTAVSSKNIDWSRSHEYVRGDPHRVSARDTSHIFLILPLGAPDLKEAIDRALQVVPGSVVLIDARIYSGRFRIPLIYGQNWYRVEGTPLYDPNVRRSE